MARQALSATQAARELDISRATVLRLYHAGILRGYRTSNNKRAHIRIYVDSLNEFKKLQERQPAEAKT